MSARLREKEQVLRLFFLVRSLECGGAERQLIELARELVKRRFDITVCTFYDGGALRHDLASIPGIRLLSLAKRGRWDVMGFLWRLQRTVRAAHPDVIHGYMPIANELSLLMARLFGAACVWGIRASAIDYSHYDWLARCAFASGAFWSRFPDAIICNSEAGRDYHARSASSSTRMVVIPNGIDCDRFCPNANARASVRSEFGIGRTERVIGIVGRLDPMKGHQTFLEAASLVARRHDNVRFMCVGSGRSDYTEQLIRRAKTLGLAPIWTGARDDVGSIYNALDILVLSSTGEGFPNVVAEAMATGRPCVAAGVGDTRSIVGDTGRIVAPGDPCALATGIGELLALDQDTLLALGMRARERIAALFSTERLGASTETVLRNVAASRRGAP